METNVNWFPFPHQNPLELNLTHFGRFSGPNVQCQHNRFHAFTIPTLMNSIVIHITLQPSIWWGHTQLSKPAANCHVSNCPNALAPRCEAVIYQGRALKNMRHQGLWQCPEIRLHQNGSRCMLSLSLSLCNYSSFKPHSYGILWVWYHFCNHWDTLATRLEFVAYIYISSTYSIIYKYI